MNIVDQLNELLGTEVCVQACGDTDTLWFSVIGHLSSWAAYFDGKGYGVDSDKVSMTFSSDHVKEIKKEKGFTDGYMIRLKRDLS